MRELSALLWKPLVSYSLSQHSAATAAWKTVAQLCHGIGRCCNQLSLAQSYGVLYIRLVRNTPIVLAYPVYLLYYQRVVRNRKSNYNDSVFDSIINLMNEIFLGQALFVCHVLLRFF